MDVTVTLLRATADSSVSLYVVVVPNFGGIGNFTFISQAEERIVLRRPLLRVDWVARMSYKDLDKAS